MPLLIFVPSLFSAMVGAVTVAMTTSTALTVASTAIKVGMAVKAAYDKSQE